MKRSGVHVTVLIVAFMGLSAVGQESSPPPRSSEGKEAVPSDFERLRAVLAELDGARVGLEQLRARHGREQASLDAEIGNVQADVDRREENVSTAERVQHDQEQALAEALSNREHQHTAVVRAATILEKFAVWLGRELKGEPEWSHDGRRGQVRQAVSLLHADPPDLTAALRVLWTTAAETVALAGRCEMGEREVDTGAETVVAATLRIGSIALLFVTPDTTRAGLATGRAGGILPRVLSPEEARETARAIDVLRRVRSPRRVVLPFPLESLVPPPPGPDLGVPPPPFGWKEGE